MVASLMQMPWAHASDGPAASPASVESASPARRPRVGLVLGGGGARGAAHVGVLQVLKDLRVPVDCVAGTSMGALVSAAFSLGLEPEQMRQELAAVNWQDLFLDAPNYADASYRRKSIDQRFIPGSEMGLGANGVVFPPGVITGQKIKLFFNQLVRANLNEREIQSLPLPLSILATDIGTGQRVVLRQGSLTQAMRASMSVPGLMVPVNLDGHKLVDGGLVDNLPIEEVRERCDAEVVIAVNVGSPLLPAESVGSLLSVSAQMINILTEQNVARSMALLQPRDIYIRPDLAGISSGDFRSHAEAADRGRDAALQVASRLATLAVTPQQYQAWWERIVLAEQALPRVDAVQIAPLQRTTEESVAEQITQPVGAPINTPALTRDLLRVYSRGDYLSVDYQLLSEHDRNILRVTPIEKPWGPDYLRLAINLQSDLEHGSTYSLRGAYHRTGLNELGGQAIFSAEVGTQTSLGAEFYQPLDRRDHWFLEPLARVKIVDTPIYQNGQKIADYSVRTLTSELAAGMNLNRLGQLKLGALTLNGRATLDTGVPILPQVNDAQSGWFTSVDLDQLDHLYFANSGWAAHLRFASYPNKQYNKFDLRLKGAFPWNNYVVQAAASYSGAVRGNLPGYDAGSLGGFLNLSGYARGQFLGDHTAYGRLGLERILGSFPLGLRGDMRVGVAAEWARIGTRFTETQSNGPLNSAVMYLGGETPLGPVYLGFGFTRGSRNAYLSLGIQ
jgi:NTE family protein